MEKLRLLAILATVFLITACSSSKNTQDLAANKQNPGGRSFKKIFIEVATLDIQVRVSLENNLAARFSSEGYAAVKSLDMIPFSLKEMKLPTQAEIELKVKESGSDAILIVSLLRKGETIGYTRGTDLKANSQFLAGILGGILNSGGTTAPVSAVNVPGSFTHGNVNFIIQSNLYDMPAETLIYSSQSENIDITLIDEVSKTYAATLLAQLKKEKLLKH
jgi:hypothetical protein